jgi:hypothetical protein
METNPSPSHSKSFLQRHWLTLFLVLLAVGIFSWAMLTMRSMRSTFELDRAEMADSFRARIDTIQQEGMALTSKVLSWAIRSEVTRDNQEQVNQFFLQFIQDSRVNKVQYVDAETGAVLISTDKKDEGTTILNPMILKAEKQVVEQDSLQWRIATPVMGLNQKLGILIVQSPR